MKVKLPFCPINLSPPHEDVWGSEDKAPTFLLPHRMKMSGQHHAPVAEEAPGTHWIGD
jgi:hypothetical protein